MPDTPTRGSAERAARTRPTEYAARDFGWIVELLPQPSLRKARAPAGATHPSGLRHDLEACVLLSRYTPLAALAAKATEPQDKHYADGACLRAGLRRNLAGSTAEARVFARTLCAADDESTAAYGKLMLAAIAEREYRAREARAILETVSTDLPEPSLAALRALVDARIHCRTRCYEDARAALRGRALADDDALPLPLRARLYRQLAHVQAGLGAADAMAFHQEALERYAACGDVEGQIDSSISIARQHLDRLDSDLALAKLRGATALIDEATRHGAELAHKEAEVCGWLAEASLLSRDLGAALVLAERDVLLSDGLTDAVRFNALFRAARVRVRKACATRAALELAGAAEALAEAQKVARLDDVLRLFFEEGLLCIARRDPLPVDPDGWLLHRTVGATPAKQQRRLRATDRGRLARELDTLRELARAAVKTSGAEAPAAIEAAARAGGFARRATVDLLLLLGTLTESLQARNVAYSRVLEHIRAPVVAEALAAHARSRLGERASSPRVLERMLVPHSDTGLVYAKGSPLEQIVERIRETADRLRGAWPAVLITGESGVGKELLARLIHRSTRQAKVFEALNCGAIPQELIEGELLGCSKGAFTGATQDRAGAFQRADGGTLFLDEIGDLPLAGQVKLLRAIQDRKVKRLGDGKELTFDAQIVYATNRPLTTMVAQGIFRQDLYHRINTIVIHLPPLRERPEDIVPLAIHLARRIGDDLLGEERRLSDAACTTLLEYSWPGNVRELINVITRAVLAESGVTLSDTTIRSVLPAAADPAVSIEEALGRVVDIRKDIVHQGIARVAVHRTDGNRQAAARLIGITPGALRAWLTRASST